MESKIEFVELLITDPRDSEFGSEADLDVAVDEAGDELRELLIGSWNLDPAIYDILIAHGYNVEYAKTLDEKALDDVFSVTKWTAHKHALRRKLTAWEESVLYTEARPNSDSVTGTRSTPSPSDRSAVGTSPQRKLLPTAVTKSLLDSILDRNEKGKIVVKFYQLHHCLDLNHRKHLAHTIVDYYMANQKYFSLADMARFAELIADRFPPEISITYFNPRNTSVNKKHPSGMLYDRFHNRKRKSVTPIGNTPATNASFQSQQKLAALQLSDSDIRRLDSSKSWLRNNRAPGDQVLKQWNHTVLLRLRSIQHDKDKNKSTVFSEWPRYLDEDGYLLVNMFGKIIDSVLKCKITFQVDADFKYLFEKSNEQGKLFDEWEWFCEVFLEYLLSADVKDIYSRQLISSLEEGDCSQAFHGLIKPVRTSTKKRPTILQAQIDTCYICETEEEFTETLDSQRQELESSGVQFSPRIFALGSIDNFECFYVVTNKLRYKLPSLVRCLDVVLKLKFTLDLQFPESSELFWAFISGYFYDIEYTQKSKNTQILQLIAYLKSRTE
ncbi:hypothetical protein RP20_CCG002988 [Aedes albopictus]|nr:hypothetical protein RP20_CCG002988 [Aedes albopictus]